MSGIRYFALCAMRPMLIVSHVTVKKLSLNKCIGALFISRHVPTNKKNLEHWVRV